MKIKVTTSGESRIVDTYRLPSRFFDAVETILSTPIEYDLTSGEAAFADELAVSFIDDDLDAWVAYEVIA